MPPSPGWLQTSLLMAWLTRLAQSSGKPAGSTGSVHFAPSVPAAGPARPLLERQARIAGGQPLCLRLEERHHAADVVADLARVERPAVVKRIPRARRDARPIQRL